MEKNKYIFLGIIAILLIVFLANYKDNHSENLSIKEVCLGEDVAEGHNCFNVELAESLAEKSKGLMNRESLCDGCGMLFVYEELGDYNFWMKNTLIPLDIIWLDEQYRVVHIANAIPCKTENCEVYSPEVDSLYVLEINGGKAKQIGLEVGSYMEFVYG